VHDQPLFRARAAYGIDRSARRLIIVRAERSRRGPRFETLADRAVSPDEPCPEDAARRIADDLRRGRAAGAACMPVSESYARWLETPLSSPARARSVLPSLLDVQLPFPVEECVVTSPAFRRTPAGTIDVLAAAARAANVRARIGALEKQGLEASRLDHEGLALWTQSLREQALERGAIRVVAYVGEDRVTLAVGRGTEFLGAHSVRREEGAGSGPLTARIQQILRAAVPGGGAAVHWLWAGPGAEQPEPASSLQAAQHPFPVTFLRHAAPATFLARALATRALGRDPLPCDFRIGTLTHPAVARYTDNRRTRALASVAAAGLTLCVLATAWNLRLDDRVQQAQARLGALAAELAGTSKVPRGQELLTARRALERRAPLAAPFRRAFEPRASAVLAALLRTAREGDLRIEYLSLTEGLAELRGTAPDWDRCGRLADVLRDHGFAAREPERQEAGADERVPFSVAAGARAEAPR
jgi:hypothetical protein